MTFGKPDITVGRIADSRGNPHLSLLLVACVACGDAERETGDLEQPTWITDAESQFGDAPDRNVFFSRPYVRADPARNRVLVLDGPNSQVSAWSSEGVLLFTVGRRGEGPGEFVSAEALFVEEDGSFTVLESGGARFTYFTPAGELVETVRGKDSRVSYRGFGLALTLPRGGSYLGVPSVGLSVVMGHFGGRPFDIQPLLRVRRADTGQWHDPEPLLWLDYRNRYYAPELPDGSRVYATQPFGDGDQVRLEAGVALVMRQKDGPGAVELIEMSAEGDTAWHRLLQFEPRRLTPERAQDWVDERVALVADRRRASGFSMDAVRKAYDAALYRPEYLPAATGSPVLATSGEVWLRTTEISDTLRVHYVVRRGNVEDEPRRVLLPEWLRVSDATETHVWGIWWDSMDKPHVVGRRLLPQTDDS